MSKRALLPSFVCLSLIMAIAGVASAMQAREPASPTQVIGRQTTQVKVVRDTESQATATTAWEDVPGASVTITVAANNRALILVRFSAESSCTTNGGTPENYCSLRVLVNDVEAAPAAGTDFKFDQNSNSGKSFSMDRSIGPLEVGSYVVKLQWTTVIVNGGVVTFTLDDWSFTVERVRA